MNEIKNGYQPKGDRHFEVSVVKEVPPNVGSGVIQKKTESEIRKETVMEIVDWLDNNVYRIKNFREFIKIRFGVEVDE